MGGYARPAAEGLELFVRVKPRASRTRILGERDGWLEIQVAAPPVEGAANEALIELLSKRLGVPKRQIALVAGQTGRQKRFLVTGIALEALHQALQPG